MWLVILWFLVSGCSLTVRDRVSSEQALRVDCKTPIYTTASYCEGDRAYSDLVQSASRIKITNLENSKSITIAVYRREGIKGVCIPDKYSHYLGRSPFRARLDVLRCGPDDVRVCPAQIRGLASYYGEPYHGRESSYGITYDMHGFYAAHRELPLGTLLRVRNLKNGREVDVKVIDRGPFVDNRVLDLSYGAARALDMIRDGVVEVEAKVLRCGD